MTPPKLTGSGRYKTNFVRTKYGNGLMYGTPHLWVQVEGAKYYLTAILWKLENGRKKLIQVDQGDKDPDTINEVDKVRLEMFDRDKTPLDVGNYILEVRSDVASMNAKQGGYKDYFCIYPTKEWYEGEGRGKKISLTNDEVSRDIDDAS